MPTSDTPHAAGRAAHAVEGALPTDAPVASADVAIGDWDLLFRAVKDRLRATAGTLSAAAASPAACGAPAQAQASVLECVAALDQLHLTLTHELDRRRPWAFGDSAALAARPMRARQAPGDARASAHRLRRAAPADDPAPWPPNGRVLRERLDAALSAAAPHRPAIALLYLDLDGFRSINDTHGHDAGDELLQIVAARLARAVRADDPVGRMGGDEFACVLADVPGRVQLIHLACKLFDAVSAPLKIGDLRLTVHPSIGIASGPTDGATAEALLRSADAAMVRAKRQKIGYAFFDARADVWRHESG
ncbi:MAG: GGDEF domain-containing protein [Burkholderiales bacterium]|nr:GGDEF domain-containing protein [Burkholderiales bacterium]